LYCIVLYLQCNHEPKWINNCTLASPFPHSAPDRMVFFVYTFSQLRTHTQGGTKRSQKKINKKFDAGQNNDIARLSLLEFLVYLALSFCCTLHCSSHPSGNELPRFDFSTYTHSLNTH
jgi:hypothetical protein